MHKNRDVQNRLLAAWYATQSLEKLYEKYHRLRAQAEKVTPHYSLAPASEGKQYTDIDFVYLFDTDENEWYVLDVCENTVNKLKRELNIPVKGDGE